MERKIPKSIREQFPYIAAPPGADSYIQSWRELVGWLLTLPDEQLDAHMLVSDVVQDGAFAVITAAYAVDSNGDVRPYLCFDMRKPIET